MAVAFIQEWHNSAPGTDNYDAVATRVDVANDPPAGLIAHTAGFGSDGVWRIFDIWESRDHAERFQSERLEPILNDLMRSRDGMSRPDRVDMYELHDVVSR